MMDARQNDVRWYHLIRGINRNHKKALFKYENPWAVGRTPNFVFEIYILQCRYLDGMV